MGVVLGEAADPGHPVQLARLLVAVHRAEFGQPQRQIAIAPRLRLENLDVVRAVHRPQQIPLAFLQFDRRELAVLVVGKMAGNFVQVDVADHRRVHWQVFPPQQLVVEEVFQLAANDRPLGQPEDQPGTHGGVDEEQFELLSQEAMVSSFRLFDLFQVGVQVLLVEEGGAVEPLQLLSPGVALPIRAGHGEEFEGPDRARAGHVRPAAEVDEFALAIEGHRRFPGQALLQVLDLQ